MNMDQYIGRLLDNRYEILEVIGTGGMAVVYKARCHRLNRLVAIKILKDEFARDEEFRRRFHAEGEAVAMLSHPNIVQVFDVSSTDTANFIVMELIDGISLKQYMEKKGVLNWKETLHFAMQIGKGLEHAHSRGIVHRDIKPHNVMVLKNGSVKVMDFGIARVMNKSNTLTKEALGSVHYISPEQAKGGHTDNRSDLYSLSVVMYEMMTGRPPYDGESAVAVAIQHINGGAAMPSTLNPNIPGGLEQIIMKGMALEIKDRYVSATEMLQDMEEFRKNPAILFHYKTMVDSATRQIPISHPRTTAERVVQSKTGAPKTRASSDSARLRQGNATGGTARKRPAGSTNTTGTVNRTSGSVSNTGRVTRATGSTGKPRDLEAARRAQMRKREEEERREEERNRVATIAIVVCSAVAVVAIIILLFAIFNGALLNREKDEVEVPYLVGQMYSDDLAEEYSDFVIKLQPQEYDDYYRKGEIMHQEPMEGSKVKKGSSLWLTVSLGEEPEVKIMEDYIGFQQEQVISALNGQGFLPLVKEEPSDEFAAGEIIRTDPAADTELTEGQEIKLFVSSGPDQTLGKVPDVVGKDVEHAKDLLNVAGFFDIKTEPVASEEVKGTVLYQSERKDQEINVKTQILLQISEGPAETTEAPTEEETEPENQPTVIGPVSKTVDFELPARENAYVLSIYLDGQAVIESTEIQPGTAVYTVELTGEGTKVYELRIDGEFERNQEVKFTDD